jgi:uncharacterized protein YbjQ (UPF0145 family)
MATFSGTPGHHMVSTGFDIPGYRVVRTLGVVRGIVVRSRSIFGTIGAGLQTLVGGNITLLTNLCEKTRNDAFDLMLRHAAELGANALLAHVMTRLNSCKASPKCSRMAPRSSSKRSHRSSVPERNVFFPDTLIWLRQRDSCGASEERVCPPFCRLRTLSGAFKAKSS